MSYRCPDCKADVSLYEIVEGTGWREVNPDGSVGRRAEEMGYEGVEPTGEIGCGECDWKGYRGGPHDFEKIT